MFTIHEAFTTDYNDSQSWITVSSHLSAVAVLNFVGISRFISRLFSPNCHTCLTIVKHFSLMFRSVVNVRLCLVPSTADSSTRLLPDTSFTCKCYSHSMRLPPTQKLRKSSKTEERNLDYSNSCFSRHKLKLTEVLPSKSTIHAVLSAALPPPSKVVFSTVEYQVIATWCESGITSRLVSRSCDSVSVSAKHLLAKREASLKLLPEVRLRGRFLQIYINVKLFVNH